MILRVLVVDDEPDVEALFRQQFRRELRDGLCSLDFALSAEAALEMLDDAVAGEIILLVSDINMPETEFATRITMPSMDFQKICRDMTLLSAKTVDIKNVGSTLTFTCKGPFASQTVTMGDSTSDIAIDKQKPDEIVSGTFSLPHLVLFTKCSNLSNNLEVHMKNDWFLMIRYVIANLGDIKLCLMPCSS